MKTEDLRIKFLDFFAKNSHTIVPSSSLVPTNDPSLLFTNAGMVQFKDLFLGAETRDYSRAASSQKCVRAGGKHNDLENVGFTSRHHTFFEMLGNFSFGDYFKREAIKLAWEFVTEELKLPKEKLWITVYKDDQEAEDIWLKEIGVSSERFSRCGEKDNFWSMGDTGPCGPCSEIFYDHGAHIWGGPPGSKDEDGDRYTEIWNLVFMQFHRSKDGQLNPLPKPSIDTGMGLERVAAVLQGVHSNYEIDIFVELIDAVAKLLHCADNQDKSLRVIADHIRACAFLIADGVMPSNEGRGYVLRRIMRRAIRHGKKLGSSEPFFYKLIATLASIMGAAYPDLKTKQKLIETTIQQEEVQFAKTLEQGLKLLDQELENLTGKTLAGDIAFKLYDTYGFPLDLTADITREREISIDEAAFRACMREQQERARSSGNYSAKIAILPTSKSVFVGYENTVATGTITEVFQEQQNDELYVILDKTPFYAESGGQVGDRGELIVLSKNSNITLQVKDTKKIAEAIVHVCDFKDDIVVGTKVTAVVNAEDRNKTRKNHSATHLLHAALKKILGIHVNQKGSLVYPAGFRFDFSHPKPLTTAEITEVELLVNQEIIKNSEAIIKVMPYKDAVAYGAVALFGEKYGSEVRVLSMGDNFSVELCGGTHVSRTGEIGLFKIIAETGVAAGVRRIEGITGMKAFNYIKEQEEILVKLSAILKSDSKLLETKINRLIENNKLLTIENTALQRASISGSKQDLSSKVRVINNLQVIAEILPVADPALLRETIDNLKAKLKTVIIVLAASNDNKISIAVGVTKDCTDIINAGELAGFIAAQVGGKGGGRPDFAQAGGSEVEKLGIAMESVFDWIKDQHARKGKIWP
jgi:alanyl-tRNA synthetase